MNGIMGIGIRSLLAYQTALTVTSQNMSNILTPFYSRREIDFGDSVLGGGVNIADVRRVFDETASRNVQQNQSVFSKMDIYLQRIQDLETLLDNSSNSVATFISDSLNALRTLNSSNTDQNRSTFLNKLNSLANQFQRISGQISSEQQNINQSMQSILDNVNELTSQIAQVNLQIGAIQGQDQSDLLDLREQLVQELAQYVDFTTLIDPTSGEMNIYIGNGTLIVANNQSYPLVTAPDPAYPNNLDILVSIGSETIPVTNFIQNGQLAGLLNYGNDLAEANRALGRLALAMADALNSQNKLGMDKNGNLGGNIFNDINNTAAMIDRAIANLNNTGSENITVSIDDTTQLTTSDYQLQFDSTGTHYILTRLSDNYTFPPGAVTSLPQSISVDGFTININSGTIAPGDQFIISPTATAANSISLLLNPQTQSSLLALASPINITPAISSQSDGIVKSFSVIDTTNPSFSIPKQLNPPVIIDFITPTSYQILNANDNSVISGPIVYDPSTGADIFPAGAYDPGYRVRIEGKNIQAGDKFTVNYNINGTGDTQNGKAMADLYDTGLLEQNSYTFIEGYDALKHKVIINSNAAKSGYDASESSYTLAKDRYDEISGVMYEQELINLESYQQAYTASAQILEAAKSIFDTIIQLGRH